MVSRSGGVAEYPLPPLPFMSLFLLMRLSFPFSNDGRCVASHLRLSVRRVSQLGHSWRSGFAHASMSGFCIPAIAFGLSLGMVLLGQCLMACD